MQENVGQLPQQTGTPASSTLLGDPETLALNRTGRMSPNQIRQLGATISLARWLFYPIGMALLVVVFVVGLFAAAFGSALHLSFEVIAAQYGLFLAGLLIALPMTGNRGVLAQVGGSVVLGLAFSAFVLAATQDTHIFIALVLMFGTLAALGGIAQVANGESRDLPSRENGVHKIFATSGIVSTLFLAVWFISSFVLLVLFMAKVNWVGPLVMLAFFYLLFVWATADEYFAGRAAKRAAAVPSIGEVTWDAGTASLVARIDGKHHRAHGALPAPGLYRFYTAPATGEVLSAERLTDAELAAHATKFIPLATSLDPQLAAASANEQAARLVMLRALRKSLHFSIADLNANQRGHVSLWQFVKRALPQLGQMIVIVYFTAVGGLLLGYVLSQVQVVAEASAALATPYNLTGVEATLVFIALCALILVIPVTLRLCINRVPRILSQQVVAVDGAVTSTDIDGATPQSFYMKHYGVQITGQSLPCAIPLRSGRAFAPGQRYRFFVHAATRDILSAMPVESVGAQSL